MKKGLFINDNKIKGKDLSTYLYFFSLIFLIHISFSSFIDFMVFKGDLVFKTNYPNGRTHFLIRVITSLLFIPVIIFKLNKHYKAIGFLALSIISIILLCNIFPHYSNHFFLEVIILVSFALYYCTKGNDQSNSASLVLFLQAIVIIVFIGSGWQKIVGGTYFNSSFLAHSVAKNNGFAIFFQLIAPNEVLRLKQLPLDSAFYFKPILLKMLSYSIPIIEVTAGLMMLSNKSKFAGAIIITISLIFIELSANQYIFGLFFMAFVGLHFNQKSYRNLSLILFMGYIILLIYELTTNTHNLQ